MNSTKKIRNQSRPKSLAAEQDLEQEQFEMEFRSHGAVSPSQLFEEPVYKTFLNFTQMQAVNAPEPDPEEEEDDEVQQEADDVEGYDRDSYKNADQEDMYYFI